MTRMEAAEQATAGGHIPQLDLKRRLRLAREDAGLEQIQLADRIGVAVRSIINYEKGYTHPKKHVLLAWAVETGVPLSWLAEGYDPDSRCSECEPRSRCCSLNAQVIDLDAARNRDLARS